MILSAQKNSYERLLSSPESNSEAEIALRLISLYFASDNKNLEKMADEAEELLKSLSSNDALHAEFIRAFAPWVSKCVIPPGNNSLVFREEGTETQKRLSTFFRDTIIALIFSERMSSLSEEEQSALRQSAVTLDRFSGRFFHAPRCGYVTVSRREFTENELRMKEVYASLGIEDNRPVFKDEAAEKRAKVGFYIRCIIAAVLILLLIFAVLALHFNW